MTGTGSAEVLPCRVHIHPVQKQSIENVLYHYSVSFFAGINNMDAEDVSLDHF